MCAIIRTSMLLGTLSLGCVQLIERLRYMYMHLLCILLCLGSILTYLQVYLGYTLLVLENVEHCGGEPEQTGLT